LRIAHKLWFLVQRRAICRQLHELIVALLDLPVEWRVVGRRFRPPFASSLIMPLATT
jgi:hypothetical protein